MVCSLLCPGGWKEQHILFWQGLFDGTAPFCIQWQPRRWTRCDGSADPPTRPHIFSRGKIHVTDGNAILSAEGLDVSSLALLLLCSARALYLLRRRVVAAVDVAERSIVVVDKGPGWCAALRIPQIAATLLPTRMAHTSKMLW